MARQRGTKFQADVIQDGVRTRRSFNTLEEAEAFERAIANGVPLIGATTFYQFHHEHFQYIWGEVKGPKTVRINLDALDKFIPAHTPIPNITSGFIVSVISRMKEAGVGNATINRRLSTLSRLLRHAEAMELTRRPRISYLKEAEGRERVLSKAEEVKMNQFFDHMGLVEAKALCNFLLYTGCRLGETFTLPRSRVVDNKATFHYTITKTSRTRIIPLVGPALEAWKTIGKMHPSAELPFKAYPRDTFRGHWTRLRAYLGLLEDEEFVPHMLRHSCASRLVSKGIPLPQVMTWMGHKNIQTTMRYSHLAPGGP